jgi:hypothetical protein
MESAEFRYRFLGEKESESPELKPKESLFARTNSLFPSLVFSFLLEQREEMMTSVS